ncbi:MAG: SwmB domain-containing protein, partial [Gammaproteobacteria bacterium]|nr:SwmB domain-containing protein [Gammaproteobacteria bacterium]
MAATEFIVTDGDASRTVSMVQAAAGSAGATATLAAGETLTLTLNAALPSTGSTPRVAYTVPSGGLSVSSTALPAGGVWADVADDGVGPVVSSASLTTKTTVVVTISERVTGMTSTADWTVAGVSPSSVTAGGSTTDGANAITVSSAVNSITLTLAEANAQAADGAPTVTYSPQAAQADRLADVTDRALASTSDPHVRAADRVRPSVESVGFGSTTVEVTFDENVRLLDGRPFRVTIPGGGSLSSNPTVIHGHTLQFGVSGLIEGVYRVEISARVTDLAGNIRAESAARVEATRDTVAPTLVSASFTAANTILLTFSEALSPAPAGMIANYAVTIPDGDDTGDDPDAVSLSAATYTAGETTVTLTLTSDAAIGVIHTIAPTAEILDAN